MIINNLTFVNELVANCIIYVIFTFIALKYFKFVFPISISSVRSALSHDPIPRGLGIIFPISFIVSSLIFYDSMEIIYSYYFLILFSTLIGFYDDVKNINYIKKLISLLVLFSFMVLIDKEILLFDDIFFIYSFLISVFFFIFYVLFFNQIDGINGLSSGTFCIFLIGLITLNSSEFLTTNMFINIIGIIILYFFSNTLQTKFFQGDSGAYFLGAVSYLAFQENDKFFLICLILLFPILGDIVWTTLMRVYFGYNLSQPHREHLYQKSVTLFKYHLPVTLCHILIQIFAFCLIYAFELHRLDLANQLYCLMIFSMVVSFFYIYTSYSFNKNR